MWLIPFSPGLDHVVTIHFDRAESIAGLRFWNYNKSPEDTYRGVRGAAATLSPLPRGRALDEWLVWLPERSINPPEFSKWQWGLQPRGESAAVSFCRKQQTQPKSRADGGTCSARLCWGFRGHRAGPPRAVAALRPLSARPGPGPGASQEPVLWLDHRPASGRRTLVPSSFRG